MKKFWNKTKQVLGDLFAVIPSDKEDEDLRWYEYTRGYTIDNGKWPMWVLYPFLILSLVLFAIPRWIYQFFTWLRRKK
jgi:hypothetical protein